MDSKFLVMREFVQHWCHCRKTFALLRPSVEIAAVSTAPSESESTVSALGWRGSWPETCHGKGKGKEKGKGKGKGKGKKGKGKKGKEKRVREMKKARVTAGKEKVVGGSNRFVVTGGSAGNGGIRRLSVTSGRRDDRWNLVQWCLTRRQQQPMILDPRIWATHAGCNMHGRQRTTIREDSPTSEAPLYSLDVEVPPSPGERDSGTSSAVVSVLEDGSKVELAGLVRD